MDEIERVGGGHLKLTTHQNCYLEPNKMLLESNKRKITYYRNRIEKPLDQLKVSLLTTDKPDPAEKVSGQVDEGGKTCVGGEAKYIG